MTPPHADLPRFWRDLPACCFTQWHIITAPDAVRERAKRIAAILQSLSLLQLYGIVLDSQPLLPNQFKETPAAGTEKRREITLFPAAASATGLIYLRFAIPGPRPQLAKTINLSAPDMSHPDWQLLDSEVFPFLALRNGVPVHPTAGSQRIKSVAVVELPAERRPQPGRPPLEAALIDTAQKAARAQSAITRLQRAQQQPPPTHFERAENYQKRLAYLPRLPELASNFFAEVAPAQSHLAGTIRTSRTPAGTTRPLRDLSALPALPRHQRLPAPPRPAKAHCGRVPGPISRSLIWLIPSPGRQLEQGKNRGK